MMKKIVYILSFLLCFSCANEKKADMMTKEEIIVEEDFKVDESSLRNDADGNTDTKSPEVDFSLISYLDTEIEEKLQANYEAKILAVKHPEFKAAIKEQLAGSDKFSFTLSDSIETIEIKDIKRSGVMTERNDSITTQKVTYTSLINSKYKQKDSVLVVMKHTMIIIDNEVKINTSFLFEKLDSLDR